MSRGKRKVCRKHRFAERQPTTSLQFLMDGSCQSWFQACSTNCALQLQVGRVRSICTFIVVERSSRLETTEAKTRVKTMRLFVFSALAATVVAATAIGTADAKAAVRCRAPAVKGCVMHRADRWHQ